MRMLSQTLRAGPLAAVALGAALFALAPSGQLGYDAMYQLVWGDELLHGRAPQLDATLAPTSHPLQVLASVPLAALGGLGDDTLRLLSLLSVGAIVVGLCRIGSMLFCLPVGLLAGAIFATRPHVFEMASIGSADVPALALLVWAGVCAFGRPVRPACAWVLIALAGLLRPEAWLAAGAYLMWGWRGRALGERARLTAYAAAGPLLWLLADLAASGEPLRSFTHTRTGTRLLDRRTGLAAALDQLPHHLGFLLGLAPLLVGLFGLGLGLVAARRRTVGVLAAAVLAGGAFLLLAIAGLSLQPRYLLSLAAIIALLAAIGSLGWLALEPGDPWRRRWRVAGVLGAVILVAGLPWDVAELRDVRARLLDDGPRLEALVDGPARGTLRRCQPVFVPSVRPIPYVAYWAGVAPRAFVDTAATPPPAPGTLVTPTERGGSWVGGGEGYPPRIIPPAPPGYRAVAANEAWRILATC